MPEAPRQSPDEVLAATLADAAAGESVTAERIETPLVSPGEDEPARLLDLLASDETPQYLLEGVIADRVRGDDRRRRMAAPGGSVFTLVTDRAVHLVVQYRDRLDAEAVPLSRVRGTAVQQAAGETRLGIDLGDERYEVYPSGTPAAETAAAAAYLDEWEPGESTDSVAALERLADLHERGALTDEEFAAAKRDVLD